MSGVSAPPGARPVLALVDRLDPDRRWLLGLAGPAGAGKSTLAAAVAAARPNRLVVVGQDGFHRRPQERAARGVTNRLGAPDTFDTDAMLATLTAVRAGDPIRWPGWDRSAEDPWTPGLVVPAGPLVILVEGSYLLLDDPAWAAVTDLLDRLIWVDAPDAVLRRRLLARAATEQPPGQAEEHVCAGDLVNVALTRARISRQPDLAVSGRGRRRTPIPTERSSAPR